MELTLLKCWDGEKHKWELQEGSSYAWHAWCSKCGSTTLLRRKYIIAGKFEILKNSKGEKIFQSPGYFKHITH